MTAITQQRSYEEMVEALAEGLPHTSTSSWA